MSRLCHYITLCNICAYQLNVNYTPVESAPPPMPSAPGIGAILYIIILNDLQAYNYPNDELSNLLASTGQ